GRFQPGNAGGIDADNSRRTRIIGRRQIGSEIEKVALHLRQPVLSFRLQAERACYTKVRIQFVDRTIRLDALVMLWHSRPGEQTGRAVITGTGIDFHGSTPIAAGPRVSGCLPFVRVNRTTGTMHDKHIVTNSNFTGVVMDESPVKQHRVMLRQVQEHLLAAHLLLGSLLESAGMVDVVHHPASPLPDLNYVTPRRSTAWVPGSYVERGLQ